MSNKYGKELEKLAQTLEWANETPIEGLANGINEVADHPLFSIGSGGSLAGAAFWAAVHELMTGHPSKFGTPLDLLALPSISPYVVGLMTASGGNPDIVRAMVDTVASESPGQLILTFAEMSPLNDVANQHGTAHVASFTPPTAKDGFLATNSLLASIVLALRGYCAASGTEELVLKDLAAPTQWDVSSGTSTYSVLHAGWGAIAGVDFESKLVEGGMADIHLTDLRNFAHGRYHWLERHGETTAMVAFITPEWSSLFERTLEHLSPKVNIIRLQSRYDGPLGAIELMVEQMRLFGQIGAALGMDPGDPPPPEYGRDLFNLTIDD